MPKYGTPIFFFLNRVKLHPFYENKILLKSEKLKGHNYMSNYMSLLIEINLY